ncbi:hypothetical protein I5Q41_18555 [Pseudomonas monteilii]|uniref:hypothetical protein n=1 Tax=Pseudomonas monteilii TaxID=76759 RepID=UPI0018D9F703|nr:hypothetical protein [Pseudomonas monteilii]MBH3456684.1 hypothetical protein [Pseudomonas monteilii]
MSKVVDFVGKLAGCSVLFLGLAFCAGYFNSAAYLKVFDAGWFISVYAFTDLVVRGIWYAAYGAIGFLVMFVIIQSPNVSDRYLRIFNRTLCIPFILFSCVLLISDLWWGMSPLWLLQTNWFKAWAMVALSCQVAVFMRPHLLDLVVAKVISVLSLFLLAAMVVVVIPAIFGRESAIQKFNNQDEMLKAKKDGGDEIYRMVDFASGKLLLLRKDNSLIVIDPIDVWHMSR